MWIGCWWRGQCLEDERREKLLWVKGGKMEVKDRVVLKLRSLILRTVNLGARDTQSSPPRLDIHRSPPLT